MSTPKSVVLLLALLGFGLGCEQRSRSSVDAGPAASARTSTAAPDFGATDSETIEYVMRFPKPGAHLVEVDAIFPTDGAESLELMMPVWTPGSYLVREFFRNVEALEAKTVDGRALAIDRTRKNRVRIDCQGADRVRVQYRLHLGELSVRTSFVDDELALINGSSVFLAPVGGPSMTYSVRLEPSSTWSQTLTTLAAHPDGRPHHFVARSYDELIDAPIVSTSPTVYELEVEGEARHLLVHKGPMDLWDGPKTAKDVAKIVRAHHRLWRIVPYDRYIFFNLITESPGGLEHSSSTVMMSSRWDGRAPDRYRSWLGLVSHELFHAWNVKRLRPAVLGPFDYENEVHTKSLWIAEGITSYYDDLLVRRAGLISEDELLEETSKRIDKLQSTPGRLVQDLESASYDAWIKFYRPDANSKNASVSYYTKGSLVAWLLDARIRRATRDDKSLDDVLRLAYARYSGERGYTPEQLRRVVGEVAGRDVENWLARAISQPEELDYAPALEWFGLRFAAPPEADAKQERAWLGVSTRSSGERLILQEILRDGPAYEAGVSAEDELIAIDGQRITGADLEPALATFVPGQGIQLTIARRGRLLVLPMTLGTAPDRSWQLERDERASGNQRRHLQSWLRAD